MDELQKDIWELRKKYGLHINDLKLKIDQMIMEHDLSIKSGIEMFEYKGTIHILR